jgi:hypothetical protein
MAIKVEATLLIDTNASSSVAVSTGITSMASRGLSVQIGTEKKRQSTRQHFSLALQGS